MSREGKAGVVPVYYSPAYVAGGPEFDTMRKAEWVATSLGTRPIAGVELREPHPASVQALALIHDQAYIDAVRTGEPAGLAESSNFSWDPGIFGAVTASTGGVLEAAREAWRTNGVAGSLSSGLHHARRASGQGYCTFNGLALAALDGLAQGMRGVQIIDLDAHCGGGTADILRKTWRVAALDIATSAYDQYDAPAGWTLDVIEGADDYLPTLRRRLDALNPEDIHLVIYNAGMDSFEKCSTGGLRGITAEVLAERERVVFDWCHEAEVAVAFVLAGGYVNSRFPKEELVNLHRLTIAAAANRPAAAA